MLLVEHLHINNDLEHIPLQGERMVGRLSEENLYLLLHLPGFVKYT